MGSVRCLVLVLVQVFGCQVLLFGFGLVCLFFLSNSEAPEKEVCQEHCDEKMAIWSGCLGILLYHNPAHTLSLGFPPQVPFCFTQDTF